MSFIPPRSFHNGSLCQITAMNLCVLRFSLLKIENGPLPRTHYCFDSCCCRFWLLMHWQIRNQQHHHHQFLFQTTLNICDRCVCVLCCNPLMAIFNDMIFLVPFKMNGSDNKRGKQCIASYLKCIKNIMKLLLNEKLSSCLLFSLSLFLSMFARMPFYSVWIGSKNVRSKCF